MRYSLEYAEVPLPGRETWGHSIMVQIVGRDGVIGEKEERKKERKKCCTHLVDKFGDWMLESKGKQGFRNQVMVICWLRN